MCELATGQSKTVQAINHDHVRLEAPDPIQNRPIELVTSIAMLSLPSANILYIVALDSGNASTRIFSSNRTGTCAKRFNAHECLGHKVSKKDRSENLLLTSQ